MLNQIVELSLKYKLFVIVIFTIIVVAGFKSYQNIPVDAFPDITPKQVVIYTESPGNSAQDIEKLVTYPLEQSLSGMAGVKTIMSNSFFGLSYISVFFEDNMDIYFLRQLVSERLRSVDIPDGFGKPVLGPNTTGLGQVFWYEVYDKNKKYSLSKLREMQEYIIAPMLKSVSGVEEIISWGGNRKVYDIVIDTKKLQNVDITYFDIVNALKKSNISTGGQYLEFNSEQYLIRGVGFYDNIDDIKNSVIKSHNAKPITIGDVAIIKKSAEPRFGAISIDGNESVIGMVLQRTGTNAAHIVKLLKKKTMLINSALPKGVTIRVIYDRSEITKKAVSTMSSALISGVVLVAIILFLFLFELRSAFIVVLSLPISLLIAFLLMDYYSISANLMSLSGLAIAVGMIVDGTIVVTENSFRSMQENRDKPKHKIVLNAIKEVASPVVFAILIIVSVFIPLLSLEGLAGKLYSPMAINIVFVMAGSLFVALVLVPVLLVFMLKPVKNSDNIVMKGIKYIYTPILTYALNNGKKLLFIVTTIFVGSIFLLTNQGREFMPSLNEESIMYRAITIPGTSLSQSIKNASDIEKYILKHYKDDVKTILSMIGRSEKGETAQANYMEILLTLKDNIKDLPALTKKMNSDLIEHFNYIQFIPTQPISMRIEELLEGVKAELAIKIFGDNQKELDKISKNIKDAIKNIDGLEDIEIESQLGQSRIDIKPNYLALARYGISVDEIMNFIQYGIGKKAVTNKLEGVKSFAVTLSIKDAKNDIESISNITFRSQNGTLVLLKDICDITIKEGPSFIKRENLNRYMVLSISVKDRDMASFVKEADTVIKKHVKLPTGYYMSWAGDFKNMQEATQKLMIIIPVTILFIMLLLYTAFNSLSKSLLILINVPFGLIGAIGGLIIADIYLSVSAIVGFIAIFAIAILNGMVLVSFIDDMRLKYPDKDLSLLIKESTLLRLRPVLMTAFTTLFGILPLLFATGVGSEIQYPLAVVVVGGIISSTFLTLIILPSTYLLFYGRR